MWAAAQEAALKEAAHKNTTPALLTDAHEEAQQLQLEDLLENTNLHDYDALGTHIELHENNEPIAGMGSVPPPVTVKDALDYLVDSIEHCVVFTDADVMELANLLPAECHPLLHFHLSVTGAEEATAGIHLTPDQALELYNAFEHARIPYTHVIFELIYFGLPVDMRPHALARYCNYLNADRSSLETATGDYHHSNSPTARWGRCTRPSEVFWLPLLANLYGICTCHPFA